MIPPVIVGSCYKYFTDCITYNSGSYLTSIQVIFTPSAGYTFQEGDVAVVAVTDSSYPTQSGWTKIVDGASLDVWAKRLSSNSDNFDSSWTNTNHGNDSYNNGYTLFVSGIAGFAYRSPYSKYGSISDSLYYLSNDNLSSAVGNSSTVTIPAVSRPSFDDDDFYYRIDAFYLRESWGSYYDFYFNWPGAPTSLGGSGAYTASCANTEAFLYTPPSYCGVIMWPSKYLSGTQWSVSPQTVTGSNTLYLSTITMWVRGWNPTQSGAML